MSSPVSIEEFISRSGESIIIDVRSESEYRQGHFPGAVNIPILTDEQRREVGITYKNKGKQEAVIKGFDLAGPLFGDFIRAAKNTTKDHPTANSPLPTVFLYCWRGGMRSSISGWILSLAGFQVKILEGGYKTFRRWVLNTLEQKKNILVLGGMTGCGKTEILQNLAMLGETVIDLEKLAHHKGSAFGGLGQLAQPSTEHFENLLSIQWNKIPSSQFSDSGNVEFAWLENESRTIGHNQVQASVYEQIRKAKVVEIKIPREKRVNRIVKEYGCFPVEQLSEMTKKLKKRLGGQHLEESLDYLLKNDISNWALKMLDYYDKAYNYGMSQRPSGSIHLVDFDGENYFEIANHLKGLGSSIMKKITEKDLSF